MSGYADLSETGKESGLHLSNLASAFRAGCTDNLAVWIFLDMRIFVRRASKTATTYSTWLWLVALAFGFRFCFCLLAFAVRIFLAQLHVCVYTHVYVRSITREAYLASV